MVNVSCSQSYSVNQNDAGNTTQRQESMDSRDIVIIIFLIGIVYWASV